MKNNKINIFFSFSPKDREKVTHLKTLLKAIDNNDVINYFDYTEGSDTNSPSTYDKILNQIEISDIFIAFLSKNYTDSTLCCWEAGIAAKKNIMIKNIKCFSDEKKLNKKCIDEISNNKNKFTYVAVNSKSENSLELYHSIDLTYDFTNSGIKNLLKRIKTDFKNIDFDDYSNINMSNLQKSTEKIIIERILEKNVYSESEKEKINALI